jgi:hypothetical protein
VGLIGFICALAEMSDQVKEPNLFVWFRTFDAGEINRDEITEHIEKLIMDFGSDGDWETKED